MLKIKEIESAQSDFDKRMQNMDSMLENALASMDTMLDSINSQLNMESISQDSIKMYEEQIYKELDSIKVEPTRQISTLETLDSIDFNGSWEDYLESMNKYATKHNIDLKQDPFKNLMSKSQEIELRKWIEQDFTYKNAKCDIYDYMIAVTCGAIGGIIDVCFVGNIISDSKSAKGIIKNFSKLFYDTYHKDDVEQMLQTEFDNIESLKQEYTKEYDEIQNNIEMIKNLPENITKEAQSHLESLATRADIIGLFFSILNKCIDIESFEFNSDNLMEKIINGFCEWLSIFMANNAENSSEYSKITPFNNFFEVCEFNVDNKENEIDTFNELISSIFDMNNFDKFGKMAIPVAVSEILVRIMFVLKSRFYHRKEWSECKPNENIPEMRRMLRVAHGSLCLIDGIDAGVRSGGNAIAFLARTNLLGFARFSHLALKEVKAWYLSGQMDVEKVDSYLDSEFKAMQTSLKY